MNIGTLKITCDEIISLEPSVTGQQSPTLQLILDDVDGHKLMCELTNQLDPEQILDFFEDDVITKYLERAK